MKNVHPTIQSITAAVTTVVLVGSLWHGAVIAPIKDAQQEFKTEQENQNAKIRLVEISQAKVGVSLENLARSIERLALQLERQMDREALPVRASATFCEADEELPQVAKTGGLSF